MAWEKIFTDYWSQTTLLLLSLAYFIKRFYDSKSKKTEINHTLFQQNRINAVNNFFKIYTKVELLWEQLPIFSIIDKQLSPKEMDSMVLPPFNDLNQSILELKIYFEDDDHKHFNQILKNFNSLRGSVSKIYWRRDAHFSDSEKANNYEETKNKILKENIILLDTICSNIRKSFK